MQEILLKIIIVAYGATAIFDVIAYWPTIKDLWHRQPSANTQSYILWSATAGITFLYSLFVLPDLLFRIVSGIFFISNMAILFLSIRIKPGR